MSPFSDIQETARRFGAFIDDIQRLFAFHALRTGSPESLATLEQSLTAREPLREDLTSLLRAINLSQPEDLPPEKILTIVALAIGGPNIASAGPELLPAVESLSAYLSTLQKPEVIDFSAEDPFLDRHTAPTPPPVVAPPVANLAPEVRDALARLELNSVQLKHYLDEIDRRMGRIEPHLQEITAVVHAAPEPSRQLSQPSPAPAPLPTPNTSPSALPEPVGYNILPTPSSLSFSASTPASPRPEVALPPPSDPRIRRLTRVIAILAIALAVIAPTSAILLIRYFNPPRVSVVQAGSDQPASTLGSLFSRIRNPLQPVSPSEAPSDKSAGNSAVTAQKTSRQQPTPAPATVSEPEQAPRIHGMPRDTSEPPNVQITPSGASFAARTLPSIPPVTTPLIASAHPEPDTAPHPAEVVRVPPPAPRTLPPPQPAAAHEVADAEPRPPSAVRLPSGPVSVSGITMANNLIYAPKPSYPSDARLHGVEGNVAVHLTINRNGLVESARIVRGPVPLQITTLDAVRSWRYKPYLVDGKPVEVETIVNVAYKISR